MAAADSKIEVAVEFHVVGGGRMDRPELKLNVPERCYVADVKSAIADGGVQVLGNRLQAHRVQCVYRRGEWLNNNDRYTFASGDILQVHVFPPRGQRPPPSRAEQDAGRALELQGEEMLHQRQQKPEQG